MGRSYAYKTNRALLKTRTRQTETPCAICGLPFRWDVHWYHPMAFTSGHIIAIINGGTDDIDNLRPEHHSCNTSAGGRLGAARSTASIPGRPSNAALANTPPPLPDPKSQDWP